MLAQETNLEYRLLVDRVTHGNELAASPKLQKFLLYITACALDDQPEAVTEQQIGVHVFGKRAGYNSSEDSIVRSQARLLRLKLASYFENEGREEPLIITIPKGQYLPQFVSRTLGRQNLAEAVEEHPAETESDHPLLHQPALEGVLLTRTPATRVVWLSVTVFLFLLGLALGLAWKSVRAAKLARSNALWRPFLASGDVPLVIYSNPTFVGNPYSGLQIKAQTNPPATGSPGGDVDETYTGTGEAEAIHQITHFFDDRGASFILKRTRLVTWDEARSRNLIFVGAPSQNTALQDLPNTTTFRIRLDERNHGYIENAKPQPGEPASFAQEGISGEFAIVALLPGPDPEKRVLILSGLTTNGTQAAAEFVTSEHGSKQLVQAAGMAGDTVRPFEMILHVRISQGVPIDSQLAYLHKR
jgi:hypothetical protein